MLEAVERCTHVIKDLRNVKLTDWPSYRSSSARSVREFERTYIAIAVSSTNDKNTNYQIVGFPEKDADVLAMNEVWFGPGSNALWGERLFKVFEACRDRRL